MYRIFFYTAAMRAMSERISQLEAQVAASQPAQTQLPPGDSGQTGVLGSGAATETVGSSKGTEVEPCNATVLESEDLPDLKGDASSKKHAVKGQTQALCNSAPKATPTNSLGSSTDKVVPTAIVGQSEYSFKVSIQGFL